MSEPIINFDECVGCGNCVEQCPSECIELVDGIAKLTKAEDCVECGACVECCPTEAITID